ncbi:hypothetical protein OCH7691_02224 [Oceanibacterium hippocampi]|uniref:Uncharacterized protein n=1 Tax=Oceanibacterium hippocampi TaxID=745714 RepID=A0A1Y5T150_9PROT|nr:hypothetical protein OCH7691_02224 [Oceanibacterium hippocampi]
MFVQLTLLSIAIAALSWHVLEKPANGLKRHFELREQPAS